MVEELRENMKLFIWDTFGRALSDKMISVYKNVQEEKMSWEPPHTHAKGPVRRSGLRLISKLKTKRLLAVFGHTMRADGGEQKTISMGDCEEGWDCYDQITVLYLSLQQNVAVFSPPRSLCIFKTLTGLCVSPNLINQNSCGFQDLLFWARFKHDLGGIQRPPLFKFTKFSFHWKLSQRILVYQLLVLGTKKSFAGLMI